MRCQKHVDRSKGSRSIASCQPSPGLPSMRSAGTTTSSKYTSQNSSTPCMVRSGRTSMPGLSMSTKNAVIAAWSDARPPVRVSSTHRVAYCAKLVHTFWPLTTQSSPRCSARVVKDARSLPEPGSEKPWHHDSRPDSSLGTISAASSGRA